MILNISSGHGLKIRGAGNRDTGLDEVDEARRVTDRVAEIARAAGHTVNVFHDDTSTNVSANIGAITRFHNSHANRALDISVHFNASNGTQDAGIGVETLYRTGNAKMREVASRVSRAISDASGLILRRGDGTWARNNLGFLNSLSNSILLEICFVNSHTDVRLYREHFEEICQGIVGAVTGASIPALQPQVQPVKTNVEPYPVIVTANSLKIRSGPGTNHNVVGKIRDRGTRTIVAESAGQGASKWGQLEGSKGWISLDFVMKTDVGTTGGINLTPIVGQAVATVGQMQRYIERINPDPRVQALPQIFIDEGNIEGIRGDIAFAQSCLETGNFLFVGGTAQRWEHHNWAGIGTTSLGVLGNSFPTPQIGVRAQIHHLKAYANNEPLVNENKSPRFHLVQRGVAPYVEWLGIQENPQGRGWAAGAGYGEKILRILGNIVATDAPDVPRQVEQTTYPISEANIQRMVDLGVISSPEFWRGVNQIQWLDELITNAGRIGFLDRDRDNGIIYFENALEVLEDAGIINSPEYWRNQVEANSVPYLSQLIVNMANRLNGRKAN